MSGKLLRENLSSVAEQLRLTLSCSKSSFLLAESLSRKLIKVFLVLD